MADYDSPFGPTEAQLEVEADFRRRGYSGRIKPGSSRLFTVRAHEPCGVIVFDPVAHDKVCPAQQGESH